MQWSVNRLGTTVFYVFAYLDLIIHVSNAWLRSLFDKADVNHDEDLSFVCPMLAIVSSSVS